MQFIKHPLYYPNFIYHLFLICLLTYSSFIKLTAQEQQRFRAGIILGLTAAQINGDESANFNKLGIIAGLKAVTILSEKSDLIFELLYSQRGSKTELVQNTGIPQQLIHLDYIEVPVIFNYKDWLDEEGSYYKMHFQGGLSFGRLFNSRFENSQLAETAPFLRKNDFSWLVGISFNINKNWGVFARYNRSINLLYKNTPNNPNANSLLSFFLSFGSTYVF